jgi:hypothetical protein
MSSIPEEIKPPKEANPEDPEPGTFLGGLLDLSRTVKNTTGNEPNAKELVIALAHMLDMKQWGEDMRVYERLKRMKELATTLVEK